MTETVRSYRELKIWQKGIELVKMIYGVTRSFPKSETYGLASQMQRAAVSIPSNIAEGREGNILANFGNFSMLRLVLLLNLTHSSLSLWNLAIVQMKSLNLFST